MGENGVPLTVAAAEVLSVAALELTEASSWWQDINHSPAWQDRIFYALAALYGVVATVALVQLVRIQWRVPEYGWTTQKVFHFLNFLLNGVRCFVFIFYRNVERLKPEIAQHILLDLPSLAFFTTYALLVLFWAEIYYQACGVSTDGLKPSFYTINAVVYAIQITLWLILWWKPIGALLILSKVFFAGVSLFAALGFLLYGGRLFLMLQRFPVESKGRRKKRLQRVRDESRLENYDVSGDYREMVMQFGYLSLFSVAWPLAACCFQINNWVELRSDAVKIAISSRRPIPWRADSIGPWISTLGFLSWLGSITSAAIVFLCSGTDKGARGTTTHITAWGILLSMFLAENFYLAVQYVVRYVMSKVESPGLEKERRERYMTKKARLEESIGKDMNDAAAMPSEPKSEKITRQALEEEARQSSIRGHNTAEEMFWQRQRGGDESVQVGRHMIAEQMKGVDASKNMAAGASPSAKAD